MFDKLKRGIKKVAGGVKKVMDKAEYLKDRACENIADVMNSEVKNESLNDAGTMTICIGVGVGFGISIMATVIGTGMKIIAR